MKKIRLIAFLTMLVMMTLMISTVSFAQEPIKSSEKEIISIEDATLTEDGYVAVTRGDFEVEAEVSEGATYKVYYDAECTEEVEDEELFVYSEEPTVTAYIVVTAEDGTKAAPVKITVTLSEDGIYVKDASIISADGSSIQFLTLEKDVKKVTLEIEAKNCTYKLYADQYRTIKASNVVNLDSAATMLLAEIEYSDGEDGEAVIIITSERSPIKFKDADKIPGWAKEYVDYINEGGFGLIQGDTNKNFNPKNGMTRYEIAAIACRLSGVDASQFATVKLDYTDKITDWALNYVKAVTSLGIMSGNLMPDGTVEFGGNKTTTRAQLARILIELDYIGSEESVLEDYNDFKEDLDIQFDEFEFEDADDIEKWAEPYVKMAVCNGYFEGSDENGKLYINSKNDILRQEMAVVLAKRYGMSAEE